METSPSEGDLAREEKLFNINSATGVHGNNKLSECRELSWRISWKEVKEKEIWRREKVHMKSSSHRACGKGSKKS